MSFFLFIQQYSLNLSYESIICLKLLISFVFMNGIIFLKTCLLSERGDIMKKTLIIILIFLQSRLNPSDIRIFDQQYNSILSLVQQRIHHHFRIEWRNRNYIVNIQGE